MDLLKYVIGQPTTGYSVYFLDDDNERVNLTDYVFTFELTNHATGGTASYAIPASTTDTADFDLVNIESSSTPIVESAGKWEGRMEVTYDGEPYNVSVPITILITE